VSKASRINVNFANLWSGDGNRTHVRSLGGYRSKTIFNSQIPVFRRKAHLLVHSSEYGLRIAWLDSSSSSGAAFARQVCLHPSPPLPSATVLVLMIFSPDNNSILCSFLSMRMRVAFSWERQVRRERKSAECKIELRDACYSKRIKGSGVENRTAPLGALVS